MYVMGNTAQRKIRPSHHLTRAHPFRNTEICEDDAAEACCTPDEEDFGLKTSGSGSLVDEVRNFFQ
jgi:hypothetical protein